MYLYDAKLKELEKLSGVRGAVSALAFSPDGSLLAAGGVSRASIPRVREWLLKRVALHAGQWEDRRL